jgi:hypothetical protein
MVGLGSNSCFVIGALCLNEGHDYNFTSSVGHPRLDSVELLVYDGICTYPENWCCITGSSRQCQLYQEWVNILGRPYEMNYDIYLYQYIFRKISLALN